MNRGEAYKILCEKLSGTRAVGYPTLVSFVGEPPVIDEIIYNGETITTELRLRWEKEVGGAIRVTLLLTVPALGR